jgi:hypothetical protein
VVGDEGGRVRTRKALARRAPLATLSRFKSPCCAKVEVCRTSSTTRRELLQRPWLHIRWIHPPSS